MTLKAHLLLFLTCLPLYIDINAQTNRADPLAVDITRVLVKDLFESNAVPYIQPMVNTINATSNARFYHSGRVGRKNGDNEFYMRVSINGMAGIVGSSMKDFTPELDLGPNVVLIDELSKYGSIKIVNGRPEYVINPNYDDTLGLTTTLVKQLFRDARDSGRFVLPPVAATLFGNRPDTRVYLPTQEDLRYVMSARPEYALLPQSTKDVLDSLIGVLQLPNYLVMPPGQNLSNLIAIVPQFELGSLYGTEVLLRFIPPVELDSNVGKFAFAGIGLKHSLSQYIQDPYLDAAIQGVYQYTSLSNTIGLTESKLNATANIVSANLHVSRELFDFLEVYAGISYDKITVESKYEYLLPIEVQLKIGLLPAPDEDGVITPTLDQPGDDRTQTTTITATNRAWKGTFGASARFSDFIFYLDYNIGVFNIVTAGIAYAF